jgi:hypothetical protein
LVKANNVKRLVDYVGFGQLAVYKVGMPADDPDSNDPIRAFLKQLLAERSVDLGPLSVAVGRNRTYFQHYFKSRRPRPRFLPRDVRTALGRYFNMDPDNFRHPDDPQARPSENVDRELLHRAFAFARRVIGDEPEDEWLRIEVTGLAVGLLERAQSLGVPSLIDSDDVVRVMQSFARRIREHYTPPKD